MKCSCGIDLNSKNSHITWEKGWKERICYECESRMYESMTLDDFIRNSPNVSEVDRKEYVKANPVFRWWA